MQLSEERAKRIAHSIGMGHAYEKHAANVSESSELLTRSSFESLILETLLNPARARPLKFGRFAYWQEEEQFLVIFNPVDSDSGTAYWPIEGIYEYRRLY